LPYEVIVADSSTDDTPELVRGYAPRVILARSAVRLPPGPARNLGLTRVRAGIVAFTDADCIVARDWITQLLAAHATHEAVGGRILNGTPGSLCGTALYLTEFVEFAGGPPRAVPSMPSCNISYRKSLLDRFGPFPDVAWGEEYILNHRLPRGIRFEPAVTVRHMNRTGWIETLRHAHKVGAGCALSRRETAQLGLLFRYRWLVPLLWGYRLLKIGAMAARAGQAGAFLRVWPVLVVQLAAWTLGFFRGTARPG
jgi:hypothetical protein